MKKQKSKFFTFVFSLIPGAGHMYMGFMRTGLSIMGAFWLIIAVSAFLGLGELMFLLPLLWFYSFFDSMNKSGAPSDEFAAAEDRWLFPGGGGDSLPAFLQKYRGVCGVILILFGLYILTNNFMYRLDYILPDYLQNAVRLFPQLVIAVLIIIIGVRLILGKRKEMDKND